MTEEQSTPAPQDTENTADPTQVFTALWSKICEAKGISDYDRDSVENLFLTLIDPATTRPGQLVYTNHGQTAIGKAYGTIDDNFLVFVASQILSHFPAKVTSHKFFDRLYNLVKKIRKDRKTGEAEQKQEEVKGE